MLAPKGYRESGFTHECKQHMPDEPLTLKRGNQGHKLLRSAGQRRERHEQKHHRQDEGAEYPVPGLTLDNQVCEHYDPTEEVKGFIHVGHGHEVRLHRAYHQTGELGGESDHQYRLSEGCRTAAFAECEDVYEHGCRIADKREIEKIDIDLAHLITPDNVCSWKPPRKYNMSNMVIQNE